MEKNELLEIWEDNFLEEINRLDGTRTFFYNCGKKTVLNLLQLKAKMDNLENIKECMDNMEKHYSNILMEKNEIIGDQKKQIIGFVRDNTLLRQKLKKCQELNQPKSITNKEFKKKLEIYGDEEY